MGNKSPGDKSLRDKLPILRLENNEISMGNKTLGNKSLGDESLRDELPILRQR